MEADLVQHIEHLLVEDRYIRWEEYCPVDQIGKKALYLSANLDEWILMRKQSLP